MSEQCKSCKHKDLNRNVPAGNCGSYQPRTLSRDEAYAEMQRGAVVECVEGPNVHTAYLYKMLDGLVKYKSQVNGEWRNANTFNSTGYSTCRFVVVEEPMDEVCKYCVEKRPMNIHGCDHKPVYDRGYICLSVRNKMRAELEASRNPYPLGPGEATTAMLAGKEVEPDFSDKWRYRISDGALQGKHIDSDRAFCLVTGPTMFYKAKFRIVNPIITVETLDPITKHAVKLTHVDGVTTKIKIGCTEMSKDDFCAAYAKIIKEVKA